VALAMAGLVAGGDACWHTAVPTRTPPISGLEAEAASVRTFRAQLVPALPQTGDYSRAVVRATRPTTRDNRDNDESRRFLELLLARIIGPASRLDMLVRPVHVIVAALG
jgi:Domain of unknown function (DUF5753)